jgi:tRNA U34 5-carboxymethylaminomethyl modifying GTPase MnmE/TrmE
MCAMHYPQSQLQNGYQRSRYGLVLLGNSGVGKSFLANILLGFDAFEHECSATSVTHYTEYKEKQVGENHFAVFNIPGLIENDQTAVNRNKEEIYKAFQQRPDSVVGFVFNGGAGGRIRDEDIIAFQAIHAAFTFKPESLLIIVNDLPVKRPKTYEGETQVKLELLLKMKDLKICFLNRINVENEKEREELSRHLANSIIRCGPRVHQKTADIHLHVEELQQLKDAMKKLKEKAEQDTQTLYEVIAQKQRENEQLMKYQKTIEELQEQLKVMANRPAESSCSIL